LEEKNKESGIMMSLNPRLCYFQY